MLFPTDERRQGVGTALSSRARRTATMMAAAMTRVDVNLAWMRACSFLAMWPRAAVQENKRQTDKRHLWIFLA